MSLLSFARRIVTEPQVFFRRLLQCFVCWGTPSPRGELRRAQVILTQAASDLTGGRSSETNQRLARFAHLWKERLDVPVYAQGEVARLLEAQGIELAGRTLAQDEARARGEPYLDSFGVAVEQKMFCRAQGLVRVIPVASVPHIWRVMWVYERLGFQIHLPQDMPDHVWGEEMEQERWRSPWTAYPYELGARLGYLYWGYI